MNNFEWVFKNVRSKDDFSYKYNGVPIVSRIGFKCIINGEEYEDYFEYYGLQDKPCAFERIDFDHYIEVFKNVDSMDEFNEIFNREIYSNNLEEFNNEYIEDWNYS